MRRITWLLVLSMLLMSFVSACAPKSSSGDKNTQTKPVDKQEIVLNEGTEPPNLDSAKSTDTASFDVLNNSMEGLIRTGQDFKLLPGIATDWKTDDGVNYTFNLRKDAKWSDGKPVTSKDFKFAWLRALDPDTASEYNYQLFYIKGGEEFASLDVKAADYKTKHDDLIKKVVIETPDDYTLKVTLTAATPYWLGLMSFPTYLPQREDIVKQYGDKYAADADKLVYNGPFVVKEWVHDDHLILEKNPTYWDAKSVTLEKVTLKMIKDANTAIQMYETGELDEVAIPGEFIPKYKSQGLQTMPEATTSYLDLNLAKKELANKKIRQAIMLALDRKGFADNVLKNGSVPARGYVPDSIKGDGSKTFRDISGELIPPAGNKEQAKKLWEEGLKELGITKMTLKMIMTDNSNVKRNTQGIQEMLQSTLPGLTLELEPVAFKVRLERSSKHDFDVVYDGWIGDYNDPMTFMNMFITGSPYNYAGWSNKQYDELIKKAETDPNNANRMKYMADAEKILIDEAPVVPIFHAALNWVTKPYVKGILYFPLGAAMDLKNARVEGKTATK